jgi:hypothetical protein
MSFFVTFLTPVDSEPVEVDRSTAPPVSSPGAFREGCFHFRLSYRAKVAGINGKHPPTGRAMIWVKVRVKDAEQNRILTQADIR